MDASTSKVLPLQQSYWGAAPNQSVYCSAVESNLGVVTSVSLGGKFTTISSLPRKCFACLNADGSLNSVPDDLQITNANDDAIVESVLARGTGTSRKIWLGGTFTQVDGNTRKGITRLDYNGNIDLTDRGLTAYNGSISVNCIIYSYSGCCIYFGGEFTITAGGQTINNLAKMDMDGNIDASFHPNPNGVVNAMQMSTEDILYITGNFTNLGNRVAALYYDGNPAPGFNVGTGPNAAPQALWLMSTGDSTSHLFLGGNFTMFNGASHIRIAKINTSGQPDTTFKTNIGTSANNSVEVVRVQGSNILVGGTFTQFKGLATGSLVRLSLAGVHDTTYNPIVNGTVRTISLKGTNGDIVIGGDFSKVNNIDKPWFACLNSSGVLV